MLVQTPEGQTPGKAHSSRSGADRGGHLGARRASSAWRGRNLPHPLSFCPSLQDSLHCKLPSCLCGSPFFLSSPLNLGIMTTEALLGA